MEQTPEIYVKSEDFAEEGTSWNSESYNQAENTTSGTINPEDQFEPVEQV